MWCGMTERRGVLGGGVWKERPAVAPTLSVVSLAFLDALPANSFAELIPEWHLLGIDGPSLRRTSFSLPEKTTGFVVKRSNLTDRIIRAGHFVVVCE